jgi:hypothetical protein
VIETPVEWRIEGGSCIDVDVAAIAQPKYGARRDGIEHEQRHGCPDYSPQPSPRLPVRLVRFVAHAAIVLGADRPGEGFRVGSTSVEPWTRMNFDDPGQ